MGYSFFNLAYDVLKQANRPLSIETFSRISWGISEEIPLLSIYREGLSSTFLKVGLLLCFTSTDQETEGQIRTQKDLINANKKARESAIAHNNALLRTSKIINILSIFFAEQLFGVLVIAHIATILSATDNALVATVAALAPRVCSLSALLCTFINTRNLGKRK